MHFAITRCGKAKHQRPEEKIKIFLENAHDHVDLSKYKHNSQFPEKNASFLYQKINHYLPHRKNIRTTRRLSNGVPLKQVSTHVVS